MVFGPTANVLAAVPSMATDDPQEPPVSSHEFGDALAGIEAGASAQAMYGWQPVKYRDSAALWAHVWQGVFGAQLDVQTAYMQSSGMPFGPSSVVSGLNESELPFIADNLANFEFDRSSIDWSDPELGPELGIALEESNARFGLAITELTGPGGSETVFLGWVEYVMGDGTKICQFLPATTMTASEMDDILHGLSVLHEEFGESLIDVSDLDIAEAFGGDEPYVEYRNRTRAAAKKFVSSFWKGLAVAAGVVAVAILAPVAVPAALVTIAVAVAVFVAKVAVDAATFGDDMRDAVDQLREDVETEYDVDTTGMTNEELVEYAKWLYDNRPVCSGKF
jgi:hypothetical protein